MIEQRRARHAVIGEPSARYAIGLLLPAAGWLLVWLYAARGHRLIDKRLDARFVRRLTMQYTGSVALYAIAVLVSLVSNAR